MLEVTSTSTCMETSSCYVVPRGEHGEMEVFSSTQGLKETQMFAAKALGVPANGVVVRVKRKKNTHTHTPNTEFNMCISRFC